jgi:hypothetical protein
MPSPLFTKLTDVTGIPAASATSTARLNIPLYPRLHQLKCTVTQVIGAVATPAPVATMMTAIDNLSFILNTDPVRSLRLSEHLAILQANGLEPRPGVPPLCFSEPWRATATEEEALAAALLNRYAACALELDITQPAAPLAFDFNAKADGFVKNGTDGAPLFRLTGHRALVWEASAGQPEFFFRDLRGPVQRLFLFLPAGMSLSRVRLKQLGNPFHDRFNTDAKPEIANDLADMGMVIPPDITNKHGACSVIPIVPDNNQRLRDRIDNLANLAIDGDLTGSGQIRIVVEEVLAK